MIEPDAQTLLQAGIAAARTGQPEQRKEARSSLLQVLKLEPGNVLAWLWLSTVIDDPAKKRACLERVLVLDPGNELAQTGLARLAQPGPPAPQSGPGRLKRLPSQKSAPGEPQARPAPGRSKQVACPFCGQPISMMATTCHHCRSSLLVSCPACLERVDVEQAACPACGQALGDFRQGPAYFAGLALAYQEHQQTQQALAAWQAVESLQPDYPHRHLHQGQLLALVGRTEAAITSLQQAMTQGPDQLAATVALGQIYQQLSRWKEAHALYIQALAGLPQALELHFALGELLLNHGRAKEALPHLRKVTQSEPQHGLAWLRLAQLYEVTRDRRQAVQAYRRAALLLPADTLKGQGAHQRLEQLQPVLPRALATSWAELTRQMTGPVLICVVAALLDAGMRPWWIPWTGWLALLLAVSGAFLAVSATSLPRNPLICQLAGASGLSSSTLRIPLAVAGVFAWLLAVSLILLPLGQSLPEVPPCPC